jgi:hypothetical protein
VHAEDENEDRRHQRAAADAGKADKAADQYAADHVQRVDTLNEIFHGLPRGSPATLCQ